MEINYAEYAKIFKVLSDPKRLKILNMLSGGELCACKIQEEFNITQPTLSHDMRLLCESGLVKLRKEGKWTHYSLNMEKMNELHKVVGQIMLPEQFAGVLECDCK